MTRAALITFAWNQRHEVFRWGRSLFDQLIARQDISPARAVRTGMVLFAIASDERFRNAKQLRRVTMTDDVVDLSVDRSWPQTWNLVERVRAVKGVRDVTVNGVPPAPLVEVTAR
ncbi:MAG: hypothetical protein ABW328_11260 [Ilumatobacteraceae bacterium]